MYTNILHLPNTHTHTTHIYYPHYYKQEIAQRHYHVDPASIYAAIQEFQDLRDVCYLLGMGGGGGGGHG